MSIFFRRILFLFSIFSLTAASLSAESSMVTDLTSDSIRKGKHSPELDFETYQRNIDDIFRVSLMARPNVDYGINNVIYDLNKKLEKDPKDFEALISLGHVYRILGQPQEANRFYEKAMIIAPEDFHLNLFAALSHARSEEYDQALQDLDLAVKNHPEDTYAWFARGQILAMLHRDEEAIRSFEKILELEPENAKTVFTLSILYQLTGKNEKALQILNKIKTQEPDNPFVSYHLGAVHFAQGNIVKTLEYWEPLFNDGVRDIQFLTNFAAAYLENKQGKKAGKILGHLNFFFPREIDVEFLLAESYRQMNRLKEAERRYRMVLAEEPGHMSAAMGLASVMEQQGKKKELKKVLKQAEAAAKNQTDLSEAQRRIEERKEQTNLNLR